MKTFDEFDWSGCVFPKEYMKSLFEYTQSHPFKTGLEIGFDAGCSALVFCRSNPNSHLTCIDIATPDDLKDKGLALLHKYEDEIKSKPVIHLSTDSTIFLPQIYKDRHIYDFIYIDSDHNYQGTLDDIGNSANMLIPNGYMIIDDCDPDHAHFGTYKALRYFLDNTNIKFRVDTLENSPSRAVILTREE